MKKLSLLFALLGVFTISTFSCKKNDPKPSATPQTTQQPTGGGSAVKFVSAETWITCAYLGTTFPTQDETVGLCYNSLDLATNVYFYQKKFNGTWIYPVDPGTYYYESYTTMEATNNCTPYYVSKTQTAAFTVVANDTLIINIP